MCITSPGSKRSQQTGHVSPVPDISGTTCRSGSRCTSVVSETTPLSETANSTDGTSSDAPQAGQGTSCPAALLEIAKCWPQAAHEKRSSIMSAQPDSVRTEKI